MDLKKKGGLMHELRGLGEVGDGYLDAPAVSGLVRTLGVRVDGLGMLLHAAIASLRTDLGLSLSSRHVRPVEMRLSSVVRCVQKSVFL